MQPASRPRPAAPPAPLLVPASAPPDPDPAPRAPPTARVAPSTTPTHVAPAAPPDDFELVEFHRSPALRRRVHPKPEASATAAFTAPTRPPRRPLPSRPAPLSDLDVQLAHAPSPVPRAAPPATGRARPGGCLISATVDTWARSTVHVRDGTFKPLVFGGTYPIDEPASPPSAGLQPALTGEAHRRELRKTIERSLDKFEAILARREACVGARRRGAPRPLTFDIDEPMGPGAPPPEAMPRDRDAKYYVAGPKTFNIDEPVSYM